MKNNEQYKGIYQEVNNLYQTWCYDESKTTFDKLFGELRKLTKKYIEKNFSKLKENWEDIFQEMIYKFIKAHKVVPIEATDFFSAWYIKVLKNLITDELKKLSRKKRKNIEYEYKLYYSLETAEENVSFETYIDSAQNEFLHEILINTINNDKDGELLINRHIEHLTIQELSIKHITTQDSIKGRLKRAKQRILTSYQMQINKFN